MIEDENFNLYIRMKSGREYLFEVSGTVSIKAGRYYEDYVQLLSNLGLKIDNLYRKHWEPLGKKMYSFIDTLRNKITVLESQVIQTSKVYFKTKEQAEIYNMKKNYRSL